MPSLRRYRAYIACLAACTLLLTAFAPASGHALAARAAFAQVCTATGVRLVRLDGAPSAPERPDKAAGSHCLSCCAHQLPALPGRMPTAAAPAWRIAFAGPGPTVPSVSTATPRVAWARAPPSPML